MHKCSFSDAKRAITDIETSRAQEAEVYYLHAANTGPISHKITLATIPYTDDNKYSYSYNNGVIEHEGVFAYLDCVGSRYLFEHAKTITISICIGDIYNDEYPLENKMNIKINGYTRMSKIFRAYSKQRELPMEYLYFRINGGRKLVMDDVAQKLGLADGDTIDCYVYDHYVFSEDDQDDFKVLQIEDVKHFFSVLPVCMCRTVVCHCDRRDNVRLCHKERCAFCSEWITLDSHYANHLEVVAYNCCNSLMHKECYNMMSGTVEESCFKCHERNPLIQYDHQVIRQHAGASLPNNIEIHLLHECGHTFSLRVEPDTTMEKVMKAHALRTGIPSEFYFFTYGGKCVDPDATPKLLKMKKDDHIDCELVGTKPNSSKHKKTKRANKNQNTLYFDLDVSDNYRVNSKGFTDLADTILHETKPQKGTYTFSESDKTKVRPVLWSVLWRSKIYASGTDLDVHVKIHNSTPCDDEECCKNDLLPVNEWQVTLKELKITVVPQRIAKNEGITKVQIYKSLQRSVKSLSTCHSDYKDSFNATFDTEHRTRGWCQYLSQNDVHNLMHPTTKMLRLAVTMLQGDLEISP